MPSRRRTLFLDADETLWHSHRAATPALVKFLEEVEQSTGVIAPAEDRAGFVRHIVETLAARMGQTLNFDPQTLAHVLGRHLLGEPLAKILADPETVCPVADAAKAARGFESAFLHAVPALRANVPETLAALKDEGFALCLLTETKLARAVHITAQTGVNRYLDAIISHAKTPGLYRYIIDTMPASESQPLMIGDQTDKDIKFAREAGFITIYIAGEFHPPWAPALEEAQPHYVAQCFADILNIAQHVHLADATRPYAEPSRPAAGRAQTNR